MWWFKKKKIEEKKIEEKKITVDSAFFFLAEHHYNHAAPFEYMEIVHPKVTIEGKFIGSYRITIEKIPKKEADVFYKSVYHNKEDL